MGPGQPPLGPWGASQLFPGGGPGPKLQGSIPPTSTPRAFDFASKFMSFLMSIFGRLGVDLGPLWGSFLVTLAPFSAQVGLGTVFEPTYLQKSDFSRNSTFSNTFWPKWTPRWGQDRPKIAPRWVQDRLGSPFFCLDFSLRCLIVFGSIWYRFGVPNGAPGDAAEVRKSDRGRSKTVLGSSWFGPFFVLRFGTAFLGLLGAS